ncbi:hypothetical protein [Parasediminibacterium sp. JCM 36343]|uniref:hypothetical protein n=1 Tax=Parasediminibacterium sp. JCM 36343 TaxID=3374279 RepID=UPI00397E6BAB
MNTVKKIFSIAFLLAVISGCNKDYNDTSFINNAALPTKIAASFTITQNNSGLVTILPVGEGVAYFDVYFGDVTTAPVKVSVGGVAQHIYNEGVYGVRVVAHNIAGKTAEVTQQLTVSFRAPENLVVNVSTDAVNNFKVNLSATALYETFFKVYYGDVANEIPQPFLEGDTISHTYAATGNYTVKVVAYSGAKDSIVATKLVTITNPLVLPITFESSTLNYAFTDFGGGTTTVIANPQVNGINTSAKVAQMVKNAGQVYGGSFIALTSPIDFSANKVFRMKVFSPRVGAKVLLKVENDANANIFYEVTTTTTVANAWEDLVFDYSAINTSNAYSHIVLIFDNGTNGDGSANFTFLMDDIRLTNTLPTGGGTVLALPLDFESKTVKYKFTDFNGGNVTVIANPQVSGINTSTTVGRMIKSADQTYGGSFIALDNPIDFSSKKTFKMKVFSPRVGAKVLLKVENLTSGAISYEKEMATTKANAWEELTFDYSKIDVSKSYQKVVLIFDNGTMGDGSANFTFLFDDISLN